MSAGSGGGGESGEDDNDAGVIGYLLEPCFVNKSRRKKKKKLIRGVLAGEKTSPRRESPATSKIADVGGRTEGEKKNSSPHKKPKREDRPERKPIPLWRGFRIKR